MGASYALFEPGRSRVLLLGKWGMCIPTNSSRSARGRPIVLTTAIPDGVVGRFVQQWVSLAESPIELWCDYRDTDEPWLTDEDTQKPGFTVHSLRNSGPEVLGLQQRVRPWPVFLAGDVVTRDGTDRHSVTGVWPEGCADPMQLDLVGETESNLARRYTLVTAADLKT